MSRRVEYHPSDNLNDVQLERMFIVSMYSLATFFCSSIFLDETTYPKIVSLTLFSCLLVVVESRRKVNLSILLLLLAWIALVTSYLFKYGVDTLESILIGYPRRNLGLLALLIFLVLFWYAYHRESNLTLSCLVFTSSFVSISFWSGRLFVEGKNQETAALILTQFTFPLRSAINQNIITLYLTLGILASLWTLVLPGSGIGFRRLVILGVFLNLVTLIKIGDAQFLLFVAVYLLVMLVVNFTRTPVYRKNLLVLMLSLVPVCYLFVVSRFHELTNSLPYSLSDRLIIARLAISEIASKPLTLRLPDTTADSLTSLKYSMNDQSNIVDNTHNVWLELGLHLGWFSLLLVFLALLASLIRLVSIFEKTTSQRTQITIAMFYGSLLVGYISTFLTILHPITISAFALFYGFIFSFITRNREYPSKIGTRNIGARFSSKFTFDFTSPKISIALRCITCAVMIISTLFVLQDSQIKWRYSSTVLSFKAGEISADVALNLFQVLSIQTKDRLYLDFTGRQFADIGDCKRVETIIFTQRKIGVKDKNARLLQEWFMRNC